MSAGEPLTAAEVARYTGDAQSAELALAVADPWRGHPLGFVLALGGAYPVIVSYRYAH